MTAGAIPRERTLRTLARDSNGIVALEMALILPLICLMVLGFYEAYSYMRTVGLVERTAASVANIMARQVSQLVDCASVDNALNLGVYVSAAEQMMQPVQLNGHGAVFLSAVSTPGNTPTVTWQRRSSYTIKDAASVLGRQGQAAKLPAPLAPAGSGAIVLVAEISYSFRPFAMTANFWPDAPGEVVIQRAAYFRARTFALDRLAQPGCAPLPTP
ncbi:MAG: hypothetical protein NVV74_13310 [Magnetospirillum sp.]|nr:hypothetical protein [Magnetospirillum sp.]